MGGELGGRGRLQDALGAGHGGRVALSEDEVLAGLELVLVLDDVLLLLSLELLG